MKKTLALLIAVLMVLAIVPLSIFTASGATGDVFAVYDAGDALVGTYATLAEADAALADGYTLKLLQSYNATESYAWGAARADDGVSISFTIDGAIDETNSAGIAYEGEGSIWSFGANCAGDQITLKNVMMMATAGADVVTVSDGAALVIESGMYMTNGRAVVRTVAGASAGTPATLCIYGGDFGLVASADVQASDAVVTNGDAGNVYIFGGKFVNAKDTVNAGVYSEYVLKHTNASGDFKIYGGVMMATGVQKGFYKPANTSATAGVSLPVAELPLIEGVTDTCHYDYFDRDFYYTSYGAGTLLLTPTLSPVARPVIGAENSALAFVSNVSAEMYAAMTTWARGKAYAEGADPDDYKLEFGTLITTEEVYLELGGSIDKLVGTEYFYDMVATDADIVVKANGDREITAITPPIDTDMKEMRALALPFVQLTVADGAAVRWYGEYNMTTGLASMADAAAIALRDNVAEADDEYQYPSATVAQAFNRYTEDEQQVLLEYLAHEHTFDFKGDCTDEDCTKNICAVLEENVVSSFFTDKGSVNYFALTLEAGVRYTLGLANGLATYEIYDENGTLCAVTNGIFAPESDGTYYLCVTAKKVGTEMIAFTHIHAADYMGVCEVCELNIATSVAVDSVADAIVVKGNTYVFQTNLTADVAYTLRGVNGSIQLYNAAGEEQVLENNVFNCTETATYYIVMKATYTGKATVQVAHNHNYDHTGLCAFCGDYRGVTLINVYKKSEPVRVSIGDKLYFNIRLEAGKTYKVASTGYIGVYTLYNAAGEKMTLGSGSSFECVEDGMYYLVVTAQSKTSASVYFEVVHECSFSNLGSCVLTHKNNIDLDEGLSCGKTAHSYFEDEAKKTVTVKPGVKSYLHMDYASKGVTYYITITGDVSYTFYQNAQTVLTDYVAVTEDNVTTITYTAAADSVLYLVLENANEANVAATVEVKHEHQIDHRGQCVVKNTTTGKTPSACKEKQSTNLTANNAVNVVYTANGIYRYAIASLAKDVEYTITLTGAEATWELKDADGNTVYSSATATQCFIPEKTAAYYLVVTATADSTGTEDVPATLLLTAHTHTYNNKGECVGETCDKTFNKQVLTVGEVYDNYLATGKHYFHVAMEAGNTYELVFSAAENVTIKLYGGENADAEMTLTEGAFACTESGTYYFVVTLKEDISAQETYEVEVAPTPVE